MNRFTEKQVIEQLKKFNELLPKTNLIKLGKILVGNIILNEHPKNYSIVRKYLSFNGIISCMYNPELLRKGQNLFYGEILTHEAMKAYLSSIKK